MNTWLTDSVRDRLKAYLEERVLRAGVGHVKDLLGGHIHGDLAEIGTPVDELELS